MAVSLLIPCVSLFLLIPCMSALLSLCPVGQGVLEVPGGAVDGPGVAPQAGTAEAAEARVEVEGTAYGPGVSLRAGAAGNCVGAQSTLDGPGSGTGTADAAGSLLRITSICWLGGFMEFHAALWL